MPKNHTSQQPKKKQFDAWNKVKKTINRRAKVPIIREGEVWWFADGQNVGVEIDGKGKGFARPVLVLTKFGKLSFHGAPLTSQKHEGSWYTSIIFQDKIQYIALSQTRTISTYRLYGKMGEVFNSDLEKVRAAFLALHNKNIPLPSGRGVAGNPEDTSIISHLRRKIKALFKHFRRQNLKHSHRRNRKHPNPRKD